MKCCCSPLSPMTWRAVLTRLFNVDSETIRPPQTAASRSSLLTTRSRLRIRWRSTSKTCGSTWIASPPRVSSRRVGSRMQSPNRKRIGRFLRDPGRPKMASIWWKNQDLPRDATLKDAPVCTRCVDLPHIRRSPMKAALQTLAIGVVAVASVAPTASAETMDEHKIVSAQEIKWGPAPPSIPPGAQAAVLYGDRARRACSHFASSCRRTTPFRRIRIRSPRSSPSSPAPSAWEWVRGPTRARVKRCRRAASSPFRPAWRTLPLPTRTRSSSSTARARGASPTSTRRTIRGRSEQHYKPSKKAALLFAIFLTSNGVDLVRNRAIDNLVVHPLEPLAALVKDFLARGGRLWACTPCIKARGYEQKDLIDGVEVAGSSVMHERIKAGAATLSF